MQGREFAGGMGYRWGFNGKPYDQETYSLEYGLRIYSPRLAKFLSTDPLRASFPWNGTYSYAENDVIRCIDLEGGEKYVVIHCWNPSPNGTNRYSKYNGTIFLYLPDGPARVRRGNNPYSDKTMTLKLELSLEQVNLFRKPIFKMNESEIIGLKDDINRIIYNTTGSSTGIRQDAAFSDDSPNQFERDKLHKLEDVVTGNPSLQGSIVYSPEPVKLHYNFNSSVTEQLNSDKLLRFTSFLQNNPDYVIKVTGHTDKLGKDDYNIDLGLSRANDVKQQLISSGIAASRIQTFSRGEMDAVVSESSSVEQRQSDRHVSIEWAPRAPLP